MPRSHSFNNRTKPAVRKTQARRTPKCLSSGALALPLQSDFSFSFMCKKTVLKMKSPSIMEKALA